MLWGVCVHGGAWNALLQRRVRPVTAITSCESLSRRPPTPTMTTCLGACLRVGQNSSSLQWVNLVCVPPSCSCLGLARRPPSSHRRRSRVGSGLRTGRLRLSRCVQAWCAACWRSTGSADPRCGGWATQRPTLPWPRTVELYPHDRAQLARRVGFRLQRQWWHVCTTSIGPAAPALGASADYGIGHVIQHVENELLTIFRLWCGTSAAVSN